MWRYLAVVGLAFAALLTVDMTSAHASNMLSETLNKLRQISIGMMAYQEQLGSLPSDIVDAQGKPLLSWRVQLLPLIEANDVYKQFHLDEPWDSPHNRRLIPKIPKTYYFPMSVIAEEKTCCVRPRGPGTVFAPDLPGGARPVRGDPAWTILVVEADDEHAVIWTKPEDLSYDPETPGRGLARHWQVDFFRHCGASAAFADGRTRVIPSTADPDALRPLFDADRGEAPPGGSLYAPLIRALEHPLAGPTLWIAVACLAGAVPILRRFLQGKTISPGESLLLAVAANQLLFWLCFLIYCRIELFGAPNGEDLRRVALSSLPRFGGAAVLLAVFLRKPSAWRCLFGIGAALWFLAAFADLGSNWPWHVEEALLTATPPVTVGLLGSVMIVLSLFDREWSKGLSQQLFHWAALTVALLPCLWFLIGWATGAIEPHLWFTRMPSIRE